MKVINNFNMIKILITLQIFFSQFTSINSVLSFTYPQTSTITGTSKILVIEKDGIFICDDTLTTKSQTLYTFSAEDKIDTIEKLSTTILKKSSFAIFILSNYKLYIIDSTKVI